MIKTNRFLSIKEVSEYIKILVMRIRKLKRRSKIPITKIDKKPIFDIENINECIKSKKVI
mgnify:FL=1|jgi:hypothetical protein